MSIKKSTFFNFNFDEKPQKSHILKHLSYVFIWVLVTSIFLFRADVQFFRSLNIEYLWIVRFFPLFFMVALIIYLRYQKWYYNLVFLFYPLLFFVWFLPKTILSFGKIYLLLYYLNFFYNRVKNFKRTLLYFLVFILTIVVLIYIDNNIARVISVLFMTSFYLKFLINFFKGLFIPIKIFDQNIIEILQRVITGDTKSQHVLIDSIEKFKIDEKLNNDDKKTKKIERLALLNHFLEYAKQSLSSLKSKRAFTIFWVFQLSLYLILTFSYFSFLNIMFYALDHSNFKTITNSVSSFDFVYYTFKSCTLNGIDDIKPISLITRFIEICTFISFSIFFLGIVLSIFYNINKEKFDENIKVATQACDIQNNILEQYVLNTYGTDIKKAVAEVATIKESVQNLKKIIIRFF